MRPRLLDLGCGAGGATRGYQQAGFYVIGVDIERQPHYCGNEFVQADALEFPLEGFDAIHASMPCQFATTMSNRHRGAGGLADRRLNLLTPMLARLRHLSTPWVVENVVGARRFMPEPILLRGGMFGLGVDRPRLFSSNVLLLAPAGCERVLEPVGVYGKAHDGRRLFDRADGTTQHAANSLEEAQEAMGMPWGDWHGVKEAIPPAYTEWVGRQLLAHIVAASDTPEATQ